MLKLALWGPEKKGSLVSFHGNLNVVPKASTCPKEIFNLCLSHWRDILAIGYALDNCYLCTAVTASTVTLPLVNTQHILNSLHWCDYVTLLDAGCLCYWELTVLWKKEPRKCLGYTLKTKLVSVLLVNEVVSYTRESWPYLKTGFT